MEALGLGKGKLKVKHTQWTIPDFQKKKKNRNKNHPPIFQKTKSLFQKKKKKKTYYKNLDGLKGLFYSGTPANEKVSARLVGIQLVWLYNLNFAAGSRALMSDN